MALVTGNIVRFATDKGMTPDPPLFGDVDSIGGAFPDVVRVTWENGIHSFLSANPSPDVVVVSGDINRPSFLDLVYTSTAIPTGELLRVIDTWFDDPDGANTQMALVAVEGRSGSSLFGSANPGPALVPPYYAILPVSTMTLV